MNSKNSAIATLLSLACVGTIVAQDNDLIGTSVWIASGPDTLIFEYTSWNNIYGSDEFEVVVQEP